MKCNLEYCNADNNHECKYCNNKSNPYSNRCKKCEIDKCQFERINDSFIYGSTYSNN